MKGPEFSDPALLEKERLVGASLAISPLQDAAGFRCRLNYIPLRLRRLVDGEQFIKIHLTGKNVLLYRAVNLAKCMRALTFMHFTVC